MSHDEFPPITLRAMPTLADALGVAELPPQLNGARAARRVHLIGRPDEQEPQPAPPRAEADMPSGVYPRKPRTNGAAAVIESTTEDKPAPRRKKPGAKKAKKRAGVTLVSSKRASGEATFVVNDRGAMSILAGELRIDLEPADVKRLEGFLANSKGLRR